MDLLRLTLEGDPEERVAAILMRPGSDAGMAVLRFSDEVSRCLGWEFGLHHTEISKGV